MSMQSIANRKRTGKLPDAFFDRLYRLPEPLYRLEDYWQFLHLDLPELTDLELSIELSCVWRRISLERPKPDAWLWARRQAIFRECDRRRAGRVG
jgi:hypothetical protein